MKAGKALLTVPSIIKSLVHILLYDIIGIHRYIGTCISAFTSSNEGQFSPPRVLEYFPFLKPKFPHIDS